MPLDQLPELDGVADRPTATVSPIARPLRTMRIEQARRQVKGPAIGLLVTGILDWVLVCLIAPFVAYMSLA